MLEHEMMCLSSQKKLVFLLTLGRICLASLAAKRIQMSQKTDSAFVLCYSFRPQSETVRFFSKASRFRRFLASSLFFRWDFPEWLANPCFLFLAKNSTVLTVFERLLISCRQENSLPERHVVE